MVTIRERLEPYPDSLLSRREQRLLSPFTPERDRSLQPFTRQYLDELIEDKAFDLAEQVSEHYFGRHEGILPDDLFSVAMQYISLPYRRWMHDESAAPTDEQRTKAYETSANLTMLARNQYKREFPPIKDITKGAASEALFFTAANRLMASSPHIPLIVVPAPLRMDDSTTSKPGIRDGVDFLIYYQDFIIPTQIKTRPGPKATGYRPEILVITMTDLAPSGDIEFEQLYDAYAQEISEKQPNDIANNIQARLYNKIDRHIDVYEDELRHDNIVFLR